MTGRTYSINLFSIISITYLVLLSVGVIPFTAPAVALAVLLSSIELTLSWSR